MMRARLLSTLPYCGVGIGNFAAPRAFLGRAGHPASDDDRRSIRL
jgi:hypothetical protein